MGDYKDKSITELMKITDASRSTLNSVIKGITWKGL